MSSFRFFGCFTRHFKKKSAPEVPNEVHEVFVKYAENGVMGTDGLLRFLREVQGEMGATLETARLLMEKQQQQQQQQQKQQLQGLPQLQPRRKQEQQQGLSFESFFDLLINASLNAAYSSGTVHQDMTEPVAHYFIYTGHNSYLTGNQLNSKCSVEPIKAALKQGVRAIELDLWPNSAKDDIQVLHGKTLTPPVEFDKCISAIKENAFVASQYPVIITLEDHLTSKLQKKAAEIMMDILGSTLYQPDTEVMTEFPAPELLKGRIIVSTKPPKEYLEAEVSSCVPNITASNSGLLEQAMAVTAVDDDDNDDDEMIEENIPNGKIDSSYTRLITIRSGKPSGSSMHETLTLEEPAVKRISLSEQVLEKAAKSYPNDLVLFTQRNIIRVYPKGLRVDSSNYSPLLAWTHGAQMVAFNMQGYGRPLWLAQGLFRANGGCGYVKKPKFLLERGDGLRVFNPHETHPPKTTLKVKVISGYGWFERFGKTHFDRYSPPDFYTRVGIAGVPADSGMKRTQTIEDEWTPRWDEQFKFELTVPELALLRIEVHEYDRTAKDDFAGQTCIPFSELKTGYRCIQLLDKKGNEYEGVKLLFHIEIIPKVT
ncbi:unnamed protein product [Sphagnum troendelagicum]|uniref:Phosphoinositide phospholipase C n=1 Tax=Sphagnum troendelagicum TaxID=128251 RepID=A0ABP0ULG3_9BRYO